MHRKGLTLLEMMITTAIFVAISGILFMVYIGGNNSWSVGSTYITLQQQTRTAMTAMINELSQSSAAAVDRFRCSGPGGTGPEMCKGQYIEFKVPVADNDHACQNSIYQPDGTLKWGAEGTMGNKIQFAAVTRNFSEEYDGKLVRLTPKTALDPYCGDSVCDSVIGENCGNCSLDCGECPPANCGDGVCQDGVISPTQESTDIETCQNCPQDCGECNPPECGDGVCDRERETSHNCPQDCGLSDEPRPPDTELWGFLNRFKLFGVAFADDPVGGLNPAEEYDVKVVANDITRLEVIRDSSNQAPAKPLTLIIKIHAQKNVRGGIPVNVIMSSQVTFKN